jgi:hypothetical protein
VEEPRKICGSHQRFGRDNMSDDASKELDPDVERRLHTLDPRDLVWARDRVRQETTRRLNGLDGCGDTLYALCFLLYMLGDAEDSRLIHAAKRANMDCGAMIDAGMLSMRRTLAELRAALDPVEDARLLTDLESLFSRPEDLENVESNLRSYFGLD